MLARAGIDPHDGVVADRERVEATPRIDGEAVERQQVRAAGDQLRTAGASIRTLALAGFASLLRAATTNVSRMSSISISCGASQASSASRYHLPLPVCSEAPLGGSWVRWPSGFRLRTHFPLRMTACRRRELSSVSNSARLWGLRAASTWQVDARAIFGSPCTCRWPPRLLEQHCCGLMTSMRCSKGHAIK